MEFHPLCPPGLQRRLRTHLRGKPQKWFASCAPGWESICAQELAELGISDITLSKGGLEFSGRLEAAWALLAFARTPSRLLLRLDQFRAENFGRLQHCIAKFPWELYLLPHSPLTFSVTTHHSRLRHTQAIAERIEESIRTRFNTYALPPDSVERDPDEFLPQTLFVRIVDDEFLVSLDATGPLLHLRGAQRKTGLAPLRDNLAAMLLRAGGLRNCHHLIDPMCGSGTFSLEAALWSSGHYSAEIRTFACQHWPSFRASAWQHLLAHPPTAALGFPLHLHTGDLDRRAVQRTQYNAELCGVQDKIQPVVADFFAMEPPLGAEPATSLLILNPPHGLRLSTPGGNAHFYRRLRTRLDSHWQDYHLAILAPQDAGSALNSLPGSRSLPLLLGGQELRVWLRA